MTKVLKKIQTKQSCKAGVTGSASKSLEKGVMTFRVDTMALLTEIVDCALRENQGVLKIPLNIFKNLLAKVAERATEINDPELNILMLSLNLYEIPHNEIQKAIDNQKKLILNEKI